LFDQWNIKKAFALHVTDAYPLGTVASAYPSLFSASCEINLHWVGQSAHITTPDKGKDAWQACVQFQKRWTEQTEQADPGVFLGIGLIHAGHVRNSIPDQALMAMTLRGKTKEDLSKGIQRIKAICRSVETITGVKFSISFGSHYPAVIQDKTLFRHWEKTYLPSKGIIVPPAWTAEDFGYISRTYPSLMCWLGCRKEGMPELGLHHPDFYPSSEIIPYGVECFTTFLNL